MKFTVLFQVLLILLVVRSAFSQVCDGQTDDTAVIQAMLNAGGNVVLPDGVCNVRGLVIRRDGTYLSGGSRTVLRRISGTYESLISLPAKWGQVTRDMTVKDVRISRMALNGNRVGPQPSGQPNFFAIQVIQGERILIDDVTVLDQYHDSISVGVGTRPVRNLTITNVRIHRGERNGVHLGYGDGLKVSDVTISDTPSQQWGPRAGNGIDVEVEGLASFVSNFLIEDCVISRVHTPNGGTAGTGIALQPAYGPIRWGTIQRNTIRNHQVGVHANIGLAPEGSIDGITVDGNRIEDDQNWTDGVAFQFIGATNVQLTNNHVNPFIGPGTKQWLVDILGGSKYELSGNTLLTRLWPDEARSINCTFRIRNASNIRIDRNGYNGRCFAQESNSIGVVKTNNYRVR